MAHLVLSKTASLIVLFLMDWKTSNGILIHDRLQLLYSRYSYSSTSESHETSESLLWCFSLDVSLSWFWSKLFFTVFFCYFSSSMLSTKEIIFTESVVYNRLPLYSLKMNTRHGNLYLNKYCYLLPTFIHSPLDKMNVLQIEELQFH